MSTTKQSDGLLATAERLIGRARAAGADQADVLVVRRRSRSASIRNGKVENTESSESDDFSVRVFVGQKVATVNAGQGADETALTERAVAMARVSPEDPHACLADADMLASDWPELDLFDPAEPSSENLVEAAIEAEATALEVPGVSSSVGAGAGAGLFGMVLATSHGFSGTFERSGFSRSVSVIAGEGVKMERDYDFDSRVFYQDLDDAASIGKRAGERVVARVNPRKVKTGSNINVVFDPRVSRGLIGHLVSAINGAAVARKTSFLKDMMDKQVAIEGLTLVDNPFVRRGPGSRPFDGEGVSVGALTMVEDGILRQWYLTTGVGRELGLKSNGRASRGGGVSPSSTNVIVNPGALSRKELIASVGTGFYVTELIGQGVNQVTGEYSRGASGFWIENGEISFPVSEVTIASNLKDMFRRMTLANDIDTKYSIAAPTIAVEGMTLAGD
ncbi:putative Zn-dependent protease [Hoeflea phototrophica DFL-43]|uniref:Putative Zn-dependent protease n=1 Tax=Hoeflea phototrophica (strain DSM 17068 / NCIMB 14078 / DFL-43) TaxID=411684 RepID=A9D0G2_HOEPD|nr:metallopeptidase TldD-related protein [Hoeflea phototrophica]EDQ34991.1 putative Zn-dependent protease [Hoeflea phototrophica DFL-43]